MKNRSTIQILGEITDTRTSKHQNIERVSVEEGYQLWKVCPGRIQADLIKTHQDQGLTTWHQDQDLSRTPPNWMKTICHFKVTVLGMTLYR